MGKQHLIDSNSLIDYLSGRLEGKGLSVMNSLVNEIPIISVITKIEVLGFTTTKEATHLLNSFVLDSMVIGLSDQIVEQTIVLRKKYRIKLPDAIIAATALIKDLVLVTRNDKDFVKIEGLELLNPYEIEDK